MTKKVGDRESDLLILIKEETVESVASRIFCPNNIIGFRYGGP